MFASENPKQGNFLRPECIDFAALPFVESGPARVKNTFSELVQILKNSKIWTSPDLTK